MRGPMHWAVNRANRRQVWGAQAGRVVLVHAGLNPFTGKPMAMNQAPTDASRKRVRYSTFGRVDQLEDRLRDMEKAAGSTPAATILGW